MCHMLSAQHIDEMLTPAPLVEKNMEKHAIFRVPIIVIPGELICNNNNKKVNL